MMTLETDRLILRGFEETDAADMYEYAQNPRIGPAAGWAPHLSQEESARIVRMFIQADDEWAIVHKQSGKVIGSLGFHRDHTRNVEKSREIGYVLAEPYWGQGLMVEAMRAVFRYAFEDLRMEVLSANHYPYNHQSRRVIEKSGMQLDGTLRKAQTLFTGEIVDLVLHSILRDEYFAQQQRI